MGRSKCHRNMRQPCGRRGIFSSILAFFYRPKRCPRCNYRSRSKRRMEAHCCPSTPCCSHFQYPAADSGCCQNFPQYPPQGCPPPPACCNQPMLCYLPPC